MKRIYTGSKRREIAFPLGGMGTGCVSLDGTGRLQDWEIHNHPSKGSINGFSHFAVKVEENGCVLDARVMNADLPGPYTGENVAHTGYSGYGYGPSRYLLSGMPHFEDCAFGGEFPLCEIEFRDETFPGNVRLEAFNPFIPSNDADSSLPAAFFTVEACNTSNRTLSYTFELSVANPSPRPHRHSIACGEFFQGIELADDLADVDSPEYSRLLFGVPADSLVQAQLYWYRGRWFDSLEIFWRDFAAPGELKNRTYPDSEGSCEDVATLAVKATLAPGETWRQRFLIAWYSPNCVNYWSKPSDADDEECLKQTWKNYYATRFDGVRAVADYAFREWDRLETLTRRFHDALYASTMPDAALEAVGANLSTLKSPTVLRLTQGQFYGFEGCQSHSGCCEGSCTHVWNYAFALPFLFPSLERSMRELDYTYNQREDGHMNFRLMLPLGRERQDFHSCVDGQMGGVIKAYREWKLCGDNQWLRRWWPKIKKSLEYAWAPTNADRWDPACSGIISGRQHHTLDMELFGPNAWLNGFYLGALKAAAEMAEAMGEPEAAAQYRALLANGRKYTDEKLFNGEYYCQQVDIRDPHVLDPYEAGAPEVRETYWSEEVGQLKYQIGEGCGEDQVLAQWMCALCGVGEILDPEHVRQALTAIYRHNFKSSLRNHFNPCRIYGLNSEAGMTICDWPEGREKPIVPIPYAEEVMNGFEYQAAIHMLMNGMEEECMNVVRGIRTRYDGETRNPWNEFECGSHYARSMASYALLLVCSGFRFDMTQGKLGFLPPREGRWFWSADGAWGSFTWENGRAEMEALYGEISLKGWILPQTSRVARVTLDGSEVAFDAQEDTLELKGGVTLRAGVRLCAEY